MVTEILRSHHVTQTSFTYYPGETLIDNVHILLNEETADDSATYIKSTSELAPISCDFNSDFLRENYNKISSVQLTIRTKANPTNTLIGYVLQGATTDKIQEEIITPKSSNWETTIITLKKENVILAVEQCIQYSKNYSLRIRLSPKQPDGSTKALDLCVSQVYIEITYSDEDEPSGPSTTETIHLKENGTWTSVSCTIYQKQAGAWVLTDATVFNNGDNFILQQTT